MGRLLQAAVLVTSMAGVAYARPATRKVRVETTPPGATVYIDDVESGAVCDATPCTVEMPLGSPILIVRMDSYEPEVMPLDISKGKRPIPISVKLKRSLGVIRVDAPKGATVKVNDEDKGKVGRAPLEIEVPAEPASVIITYNGKSQTELVDVTANDPVELTFKGDADDTDVATADDDDEGEDLDEGEDPNDEQIDGGEVTASTTTAGPASFLEVGGAFDVGFRRFKYSDGSGPFNNSGEMVVGAAVELWPGRLLGVHPIRGLSLFARAQFSFSHQKVTRDNMGTVTDVGATTFWGALEVSLRHQLTLGPAGFEVGGGFVRDQVEFSADNQTTLDMVPSADYRSLRVGARLSYIGTFEPYVSGEKRIVLSGGELGTRADTAEVSGYRVAAGLRAHFGDFGARAEFSYGAYNWKFSYDTASTLPTGANDTIMWLSFMLGYNFGR